MKRTRMLLCILIAMLLATNALGETSGILIRSGTENVSENLTIYTAASANGIIAACDMNRYQYLLFDQEKQIAEFSSLTFDDQTPGSESYNSPLTLVSDGQNLYSIELTVQNDLSRGSFFKGAGLYQYSSETGKFEFAYDLDLSEAYVQPDYGSEYCLTCLDAAMGDGHLAVLIEEEPETGGLLSFSDKNETQSYLLCYNLIDNQKYTYALSGVRDLIAFNGEWLLYAQLQDDSQDVDILALNMLDGTQKSLIKIPSEGGRRAEHFAWNYDDSSLLYSIDNRVWRIRSVKDSPECIASLAVRQPYGLLPLGSNALAAWTDKAIVTCSLDGQTLQDSELVVFGSNEYLDAYTLENGDVQLAKYDGTLSVIDLLQTRSSTPDIMILNTYNHFGVKQLSDRGYLLPLESDLISALVAKMHPDIQAAVTKDGQVVALPCSLLCQPMLGICEETWSQIGAQRPTTWEEMLLFLQGWPERKVQHPDIGLFAEGFDSQSLQYLILNNILTDYEQYRLSGEGNPGYDTPAFRNLLNLYRSLNFQQIVQEETGGESAFLLTAEYQSSAKSYHSGIVGLPLSIDAEVPSYLSASMSMMVVNPFSENKENALRLLEYVAEHLAPIDRMEMIPDENTPLRNDYYEENVRQLAQEIAQIDQQMQSAKESDLPGLEMEKSRKEISLADLEENSWLASARSIQQYRKESEHICILYRDTFSDQELNLMDEEKTRFVQGQMTIDQYIDTLQRRYVMNIYEGK